MKTQDFMTARYVSTYISSTRTRMFLYTIVDASPEMIAKYKEIKAENYQEDEDGNPLFHTSFSTDDEIKLIITKNGKVMEDRSEQERLMVKVKQFGGNLGDEMAKLTAAQLFGKPVNRSAQHHEPEHQDKDDDLNKG
jgi:hypothetical protein